MRQQSAGQSQPGSHKMAEIVLAALDNSSIAPEDESDHSQRPDAALLAFSHHKSRESSSSYYDDEDESLEKEQDKQLPVKKQNCLLF
jgi:hypothetical protein